MARYTTHTKASLCLLIFSFILTSMMLPLTVVAQCNREHRLEMKSHRIQEEQKYEVIVKDGKITSDTVLTSRALYNIAGFPIESFRFDSIGNIRYREKHLYDTERRQAKSLYYQSDTVWSYHYGIFDEHCDCAETGQVRSNGDTLHRQEWTHDELHRTIQTMTYYANGQTQKGEMFYDKKGNLIEWNFYYPSQESIESFFIYYDSLGNHSLHFRQVDESIGYVFEEVRFGDSLTVVTGFTVLVDIEEELPEPGPTATRLESEFDSTGLVIAERRYLGGVLTQVTLYKYLRFEKGSPDVFEFCDE